MEITIEITRECSLNCSICSSNAGMKDKDELKKVEWFRIIDDLKTVNASRICISGGEPFLRADFKQILQYAKSAGIETVVYTSGSIYDTDRTRLMPIELSLLEEAGDAIDRLAFGLHGPSARIHNAITMIRGSFDNLKVSINRAHDVGIDCSGHFVPVKSNYLSIEETIDVAEEMRLRWLGILRFVAQGRGKTNQSVLELEPEEMAVFRGIIVSLPKRKQGYIRLGAPLGFVLPKSDVKCSLGARITIQSNGLVAPCEALKDYSATEMPTDIRRTTLLQLKSSELLRRLCDVDTTRSSLCSAQEILNNGTDPYARFWRLREELVYVP